MSMWTTKVTNLNPTKIIIPLEEALFRGFIPSADVEFDNKYTLNMRIDLTDKDYLPTEEFLEKLKVVPYLMTKKGSDILLDKDKITMTAERLETYYHISVEFESVLHPIYTASPESKKDFLDSVDLSFLGFYLQPGFQTKTEKLIYQIDYLSVLVSEDSSSSEAFTFEPGVVLGEDLPFTLEDFMDIEKAVNDDDDDDDDDDSPFTLEKFMDMQEAVNNVANDSDADARDNVNYATEKPVEGPIEDPIEEVKRQLLAAVNNPSHYNDSEIETFELFLLMNASLPERIIGALNFNILKYRDRVKLKGHQAEDTQKMMWYLSKMTLLFPEEAKLYTAYHQDKLTN